MKLDPVLHVTGEEVTAWLESWGADHSQAGRPVEDMDAAYRKLVIDFGESGYIALYRISNDAVTVLALRQREIGY